ncbi:MAG TPA: oxygen-independent coproporphyrinogen III oxidase [Gammaproteobacteria bacterium]|nr:oxygen-independent coproporphyrinogen III oxidase [Gammaproteobacteria bacterium]
MDFDAALIQRYDCTGPRYTSYPTARQFESPFDTGRYLREVAHSNDDPIPSGLSLYVHLPFCSSPCFYCGCTRLITRDAQQVSGYLERLVREAGLQGELFDRDREVQQLHLGGGTPTLFSDGQLSELWRALHTAFRFSAELKVEASIEVDPRTVTPARLQAIAAIGFNRVSFGIQDFDAGVQEAVNRRQDQRHCLRLIEAARSGGFDSVAVDLIYGLPRQNLAGFGATLDTVAGARPDRVSVYAYAHLPQVFKAQRQIEASELPGPELRLKLLALAVERLTAAGYEYIGMDHFALPEDDLARARHGGGLQRNFQGYSTHAGLDLVGLGLSAIGHVGRVYVQNAKTLNDYYGALDQGRLPIAAGLALNDDDELRADVINRLMCYDELKYADVEETHHIRFWDYFSEERERLASLASDGLVALESDRLRVLPPGRFLLRNLAMQFDAYLPSAPAPGPGPRSSRVI